MGREYGCRWCVQKKAVTHTCIGFFEKHIFGLLINLASVKKQKLCDGEKTFCLYLNSRLGLQHFAV